MTDEEHKMLQEAHTMSKRVHDAFFEPSPAGEDPLIQRVAGVVIVVERSNWAAKALVYGFLTIGSIAGAYAAIKAGFIK